jgi:hypothetical protein
MVTVPANVPVLEYDADGIGRGLRVEKGSRNLAARSGFLDSTDDPAKVLAEPGFPDSSGGYNAFRIRAIDSTGLVFAQQITPTSGELVAQIVLKRGNSDSSGNGYGLYNTTTAAGLAYVFINYATGALTITGPLAASLTATAVPHGDNLDWWLLTLKLAAGFSASDVLNFYMGYLGSSATIGDFHYIDWVQVEPGLLPTSYIKAVSAGVVPVRDPASAVISDLSSIDFSAVAGSVLCEIELERLPVAGTYPGVFKFGSTDAQRIGVYLSEDDVYFFRKTESVSVLGALQLGRNRIAVSWGPTNFAVCVNGGAPTLSAHTAGALTAPSSLALASFDELLNSVLAQFKYATRELTIAELVRESAL